MESWILEIYNLLEYIYQITPSTQTIWDSWNIFQRNRNSTWDVIVFCLIIASIIGILVGVGYVLDKINKRRTARRNKRLANKTSKYQDKKW